MEDLSGRQFGPYRIVAPLGEGGMAAVYKAYQPALDHYVALKILPRQLASGPEFVRRFEREAKIVAQLQHPHILPVFDFGESEGYAFLAMPFVNGGTLAARLHGQPLPIPEVARVIREVCGALGYAHRKKVVHRDIKPSNILVDESGNCLLADFGIARIVESAETIVTRGTILGTPEYMAPEQASGEETGAASDIYSLGVVLYEMLTGRVPYKAETPLAVVVKHMTGPLPPPRTLNPALTPAVEAVVLKALARSTVDRFATAEAFATAFSAAAHTASDLQPLESAPRLSPRAAEAQTLELGSSTAPSRPVTEGRGDATMQATGRRVWVVSGLVAVAIAGALVGARLWRSAPASSTPIAPPTAVAREVEAPTAPSTPAPEAAPSTSPPVPAAPTSAVVPPTAATAPAVAPRPPSPPPAGRAASTPSAPITVRAVPQAHPASPTSTLADWQTMNGECERGNGADCRNAALMVQNGWGGLAKDAGQATALFERACEHGDIPACRALSGIYGNGRGAPPDTAKAFAFRQRECDLGDCTNLGVAYAVGRLVAQDLGKAATLYQRACDTSIDEIDRAAGCANLGLLYADGRGVARDLARAAEFYQRGCDGGSALGCANLGLMYQGGLGVVHDAARALALYERGCQTKDERSCKLSAELKAALAPPLPLRINIAPDPVTASVCAPTPCQAPGGGPQFRWYLSGNLTIQEIAGVGGTVDTVSATAFNAPLVYRADTITRLAGTNRVAPHGTLVVPVTFVYGLVGNENAKQQIVVSYVVQFTDAQGRQFSSTVQWKVN